MQYLVKVGFGEEMREKIKWLYANGYRGSLPKDYPYGVIIIEGDVFFGGNITCFAASGSRGNKCISWEEWQKIVNDR